MAENPILSVLSEQDCDPCEHVMRMRCTECQREQYGPAVWAISHGWAACSWCGQRNRVQRIQTPAVLA